MGYGASCFGGTAFASTPAPSDAALRTLFSALSDALLKDSPETATFLGLDKGARASLKSRLSDRSWAHVAKDHEVCAAWLGKLDAIAPAQISPAGQLDKAVASYALTLGRDAGKFDFGENTLASAMNENPTPYVFSQEPASFVIIPEFLDSQHKIETKADADAYLARMEAWAAVLDHETERVKRDASLGVAPPDFLLAIALGQMERSAQMPAANQRIVSSLANRAKQKSITGDYAGQATKLIADK